MRIQTLAAIYSCRVLMHRSSNRRRSVHSCCTSESGSFRCGQFAFASALLPSSFTSPSLLRASATYFAMFGSPPGLRAPYLRLCKTLPLHFASIGRLHTISHGHRICSPTLNARTASCMGILTYPKRFSSSLSDTRGSTHKPRVGDVDRLLADYKAATQSPSTTQADLYAHLKGLQPWLASLSPASRAEQVAEHKIGTRALLFALNNGLDKPDNFYKDFYLVKMLCLWLVAEKQETYIERWISTTVTTQDETTGGNLAYMWRADLWRQLVEAERTLIDDGTNNCDAPIERFFRMNELRQTGPPALRQYMSAWPAITNLAGILTGRIPLKTSPLLFEKFAKLCAKFKGGRVSGEYLSSSLMMFHPTRPNPYPFLRYCKSHQRENSKFLAADLDMDDARGSVLRFVERMLELLRGTGKDEDVMWARQLQEDLCREAARRWTDSSSKFTRSGRKVFSGSWRSMIEVPLHRRACDE